MWQLPFESPGKALDAFWEEARLRLIPVLSTKKRR